MANTVMSHTACCHLPWMRNLWRAFLCLAFLLPVLGDTRILAQSESSQQSAATQEYFRLEITPVSGGAELLTIHARSNDPDTPESNPQWIPMVSVLRDTLGDTNPENDRLRYLWALTYTRPTLAQRLAGAVPFLYTHLEEKKSGAHQPPPLIDLASADRDVWEKICWSALQSILLDPYGTPIRASTRAYRRNVADFRRSHIIRALSLLSLYQELGREQIFTEGELKEIQARLLLTDKTFGGLIDELKLQGFASKETTRIRDERGHNWELLRQQAEANNLYFEPLEMPDGSATHALLWIARSELDTGTGQRFEGRFLNIANPWTDKRLRNWRGYSESRFFDAAHRSTAPNEQGATEVELIPLALYGLDHPKIPTLLVDFRDGSNPKHREMSRRVLQDVTRNVLAVSQFGDLPFFLGRSVFDFITGKRGMDINQPSRLRAYAQLKLLLSLNNSLRPELRSEISNRAETVSLNPLENGVEAERRLARDQYAALLDYAARPEGLPARLLNDRRTEMVKLEHGSAARFVFRLANVLSLGQYTHREQASSALNARLGLARQLAYHTRYLRELSQSGLPPGKTKPGLGPGPPLDVVWNLDKVRTSLQFVAAHGEAADSHAALAAARIFSRTGDDETRHACLEALVQIKNRKARLELTRLAQRQDLDAQWQDLIGLYLSGRRPVEPVGSPGSGTTFGQPERQ